MGEIVAVARAEVLVKNVRRVEQVGGVIHGHVAGHPAGRGGDRLVVRDQLDDVVATLTGP